MKLFKIAFCNPNEQKSYLGYFFNDKLIGYTNIEDRKGKTYIAIGVHPDYCNQGYGQKILHLVDEMCTEKELYLEVRTWNQRAIHCYEKSGFKIVGKPYYHVIDGKAVLFYEMRKRKLSIPEMVKGRALSLGELGQNWLNRLDSMILDLEKQWNIEVVDIINGGSHALVCIVKKGDIDYILKLEIPDHSEESFMASVSALELADGDGYAKLYHYDLKKRAYLLERLGKPLKQLNYSVEKQLQILCDGLKKTWNMPMDHSNLKNGLDSLDWFESYIVKTNEQLGYPCDEALIDRAIQYIDFRKKNANKSEFVLVHGDGHNNNLLQCIDDPYEFKFIDPEGMVYEKAYDLGVLMREFVEDYMDNPTCKIHQRIQLLQDWTGVEYDAIDQWGYLQMLTTAFILLTIGQDELGNQMLFIAKVWCENRHS